MSKHKSRHPSDDEHEAADDVPVELLSHPAYEELLTKLNEAEQKTNEYWDRIVRMQADADNTQRRTEREVANAHKYGLEKFVNELIPIVDSLELCVQNESKDGKSDKDSIVEGVNMTLKMFYTAMDKFGIKQVNPQGEAFDPEFTQAISMQYDPKLAAGTVVSVLQKGYTLNDRLIRPALVVVSKAEE